MPKRKPTPTNTITTAVLNYLNLNGFYVFRVNNQGTFDPVKKLYRFNNQTKGIADIIGVTPKGRFIAVEVKGTKTDKQSEHQKEFQLKVQRAGGLYILARSLDDIIKLIEGGVLR